MELYSVGLIGRALDGTSDFAKYGSVPSAVPGQFTLAELIACGVSDDGIRRVLCQAKMQSSSVSEEKPGLSSCSGIDSGENVCNRVLLSIDIKSPAVDVEGNHVVTSFRCSDCKGRGCRLWPAPSDEEVGRAYKNWCEGTGARWQNA